MGEINLLESVSALEMFKAIYFFIALIQGIFIGKDILISTLYLCLSVYLFTFLSIHPSTFTRHWEPL